MDFKVSQYMSGLQDMIKIHGDYNQSSCIKSGTSEDYMEAKLGNALSELLQFETHVDERPARCSKNMYQMEKESEELKHLVNSSATITRRTLSRSSTFPFSKIEERVKGLNDEIEYPVYPRSESLPVLLKPISAMKGSREKHGIPPKKLTVTWANDVYDPPITLQSRTVKGGSSHRRSIRSNKKSSSSSNSSSSSSSSSKHRHKGKTSRSHSTDNHKKHHQKHDRSYESRTKQVVTKGSFSLFPDLRHSTLEHRDPAAVPGNESKCGSSFLMKSLTELHLPIAEAK